MAASFVGVIVSVLGAFIGETNLGMRALLKLANKVYGIRKSEVSQ
jgi:hypothetical protein